MSINSLSKHLRQLSSINDQPLPLSRSNTSESYQEENSQYFEDLVEEEFLGLDKEDLERAALLYEDVRKQWRMISKLKKDDGLEPDPPGMDKELAAAFDKFLKKEMKTLATELQDGELKWH